LSERYKLGCWWPRKLPAGCPGFGSAPLSTLRPVERILSRTGTFTLHLKPSNGQVLESGRRLTLLQQDFFPLDGLLEVRQRGLRLSRVILSGEWLRPWTCSAVVPQVDVGVGPVGKPPSSPLGGDKPGFMPLDALLPTVGTDPPSARAGSVAPTVVGASAATPLPTPHAGSDAPPSSVSSTASATATPSRPKTPTSAALASSGGGLKRKLSLTKASRPSRPRSPQVGRRGI
jgi:hypothetical protein